jgi:hypothetical protein
MSGEQSVSPIPIPEPELSYIKALRAKITALGAQLSDAQRGVESVQGINAALEATNRELSDRTFKLEAERDFAIGNRTLLRSRIEELQVTNQTLREERDALIASVERYFVCSVHEDSSDPDNNYCWCGWRRDNPVHELAALNAKQIPPAAEEGQ